MPSALAFDNRTRRRRAYAGLRFASIPHDGVPVHWVPEDPHMWIDRRGNWHIVNHAYDLYVYSNCSTSPLSTHFFSPDGKAWHFLPQAIQPYGHTVRMGPNAKGIVLFREA